MNEMNLTHKKLPRSILRRLGTLVLALCMALSLLPAVLPPADAAFSDAAMDKLLNWGVVSGYPDGALHPDWQLTRAEFVAMVNRAYGYTEPGVTPFIDVPDKAWFRDDINIAYHANYFSGVSPRMAGPDQQLTREQAMVLLARNMRMQPADGEVTDFTDGRDFSDWSRGYARAAKQAGVIGGYTDGTYKPKNNITRGEMAVMLQRALGTLINKPGTHTLSDIYGNVTISSPNVLLKDSTIAGNLYITGGLSLGDVTLQNVRVLGDIIIAGGGESESGESVILRNVQANSLIVDSIVNQYLSLAAEGDTLIQKAILRTSAYVQDRTRPGDGLLIISLESLPGTTFTLSGNLETIIDKTPDSTLNIAMGTASVVTIDEEGRGSTLHLDINSTVGELNLDTATTVTGVGDIGDLFVNAPGADVEMLPDNVEIRPGLTADIAGQTMNAQQAQESSSDPRLLAGYPKVKNVAPTNASSIYSANKGGTVYWAVSTTTDGSIDEAELIEPTTDNASIALSGTTMIENSNTEYTAALEKLTPDSNYYLSAVMKDARGRISPVKVVSFATPDNSVPNFASGYPTVMKNYSESVKDTITVEIDGVETEVEVVKRDNDRFPVRNYRVQIAAMPTKSCMLYYAVYPVGSTAPTAQQFRTGALGTPIRSGVEDATKNRINFIELSNLEQLTSYDIYLCYIDADGSRSSPVRKLTFRTVDGKPPRFENDTPILRTEALNSLQVQVTVDEAATVYWAAVLGSTPLSDGDFTDTQWWERACRQIEGGGVNNTIRSGSVAVRANNAATINITGLQPATRYRIYCVAKDAAGNYSEFFRIDNVGDDPTIDPETYYTPHNEWPYKFYIDESTLDNIPPEAQQEFSLTEIGEANRPYADTDISIVFSEAVMCYSDNRTADKDKFITLQNLYDDLVRARESGDADRIERCERQFCRVLSNCIKLYNNSDLSNDPSKWVRDRDNADKIGENWIIDYRWATVESDDTTGRMTVTFPTKDDKSQSALNLASGATYHFLIQDICDTSSNRNQIVRRNESGAITSTGRAQLDDFTTISARVRLTNYENLKTAYYDCPEHGREEVIMDMAFSIKPVSTNVESTVSWDIIFWSDTACSFEVYELESGADGTDGTAIRPLLNGQFPANEAHHPEDIVITSDVEPSNPDLRDENYLGFRGQGYFNDFYGTGGRYPSVTGEGLRLSTDESVAARGIMTNGDDNEKFYGIHLTALGDEQEANGARESTWDGRVNFRISVVTAGSSSLLALATGDISDASIRAWEGNPQYSGSRIHTPGLFPLFASFSNGSAPDFDYQSGYPNFDLHDTHVTMNLKLDRQTGGTVYYAVVPMTQPTDTGKNYTQGSVTTRAYNPKGGGQAAFSTPHNTDDSTDEFTYERYYTTFPNYSDPNKKIYVPTKGVPKNSQDATVPVYDEETKDFTGEMCSKLEVNPPLLSSIYLESYASLSGVETGLKALPNDGAQGVPVSNLTPETVYFVFFVIKGEGSVYSDRVQLFQFTTTELERPKLTLTQGSSNTAVNIRSDSPAYVQTALFLSNRLPEELTALFYDPEAPTRYIESGEALTAYEAMLDRPGNLKDGSGKTYRQYTVLDALRDQDSNLGLGCLFDYYANAETKNRINEIITAQGQVAGNNLYGSGDLDGLSSKEFPFELTDDQEYTLLAVARAPGDQNANASGHSLGFGAWPGLQDLNDDPPTIVQITSIGNFTVDRAHDAAQLSSNTAKLVLYGSFDIVFKDPLWVTNKSGTRVVLTNSNMSDLRIPLLGSDNNGTVSVTNVSDDSRTLTIKVAQPVPSGTSYTYFANNGTFRMSSDLQTEIGPTRANALSIRLSYDAVLQMVKAEVNTVDFADWFPNPFDPSGGGPGFTYLNTEVIPAPVKRATGISWNTSSPIVLKEGDVPYTASVRFSPTGSEGPLHFEQGPNSSYFRFTPGPGANEVTITPVSAGTGGTLIAVLEVENGPDVRVPINVTVEASTLTRYILVSTPSSNGFTTAATVNMTITPPYSAPPAGPITVRLYGTSGANLVSVNPENIGNNEHPTGGYKIMLDDYGSSGATSGVDERGSYYEYTFFVTTTPTFANKLDTAGNGDRMTITFRSSQNSAATPVASATLQVIFNVPNR